MRIVRWVRIRSENRIFYADREFQAYIDLLQDIGIDITDVPRTPENGTTNRWLYVWKNRLLAERFAFELRERLRDPSWFVHELEFPDDRDPDESRGPLAPLIIVSIRTTAGTEFRLTPASQQRILSHYPNARLTGQVTFSKQVREDYERQHGPVWGQVILLLTGIPEESVDRLSGIRIVNEESQVLHERLDKARQRT